MERIKSVVSVFLVGAVILSAVLSNAINIEVEAEPADKSSANGLTQRGPIFIDGNDQFTPENGVTSGSGTKINPYIIEGWEINANHNKGIEIWNTNAYFIICNCVIYNAENGIAFSNVQNGNIDNAIARDNSYDAICTGICVGRSSNNIVTGCTVYNNYHGIHFYDSSNNNQITNCLVYNNYDSGITVYQSSNNVLRDNLLKNNLFNFYVEGIALAHFYQDIDTSNTINGKPIYYVVNQSNRVFDDTMSIGYLALVSCANVKIKNLELKNEGIGLTIVNTTKSSVTDCNFYNNQWGGVYFLYSSNNYMGACNIYNNREGITLWDSSDNKITNCAVYNNSYGIYLCFSSNNEINYCNIYANANYGTAAYFSLYGGVEASSSVDTTYCWWGSANGPYHPITNPNGTGDSVTDNVLYEPWLTERVKIELPGAELDKEGLPKLGITHITLIAGIIAAIIIVAAVILGKRKTPRAEVEKLAEKVGVPAPELPIQTLPVHCPECKTTFQVKPKKRPFKVKCPSCGTEGVIK